MPVAQAEKSTPSTEKVKQPYEKPAIKSRFKLEVTATSCLKPSRLPDGVVDPECVPLHS